LGDFISAGTASLNFFHSGKKGKPFLKKRPETKPDEYEAEAWPLYFVRYAFEYNKRFSLLFLLGIILHVVIVKLF